MPLRTKGLISKSLYNKLVLFAKYVNTKVVYNSLAMARKKNDGRGRMGGRQKGTPNKVTSTLKDWLEALINDNRKQITEDLKIISPAQRLKILERLLCYVIPKQASLGIEAQVEAEYKAIEQAMGNMDDEALNLLAEKLYKLEERKKDNEDNG
jgi:hypothetical protein